MPNDEAMRRRRAVEVLRRRFSIRQVVPRAVGTNDPDEDLINFCARLVQHFRGGDSQTEVVNAAEGCVFVLAFSLQLLPTIVACWKKKSMTEDEVTNTNIYLSPQMDSGAGKSTILKSFLEPFVRIINRRSEGCGESEASSSPVDSENAGGAELIAAATPDDAVSGVSDASPSKKKKRRKKKMMNKDGDALPKGRKIVELLQGCFTDAGAHKLCEGGPTAYNCAESQNLLRMLEDGQKGEFQQSMIHMYSGETVEKRLKDPEHSWKIENANFSAICFSQPALWEQHEKDSPSFVKQGGSARWIVLPLGTAELPVIPAPPTSHDAEDGEFSLLSCSVFVIRRTVV